MVAARPRRRGGRGRKEATARLVDRSGRIRLAAVATGHPFKRFAGEAVWRIAKRAKRLHRSPAAEKPIRGPRAGLLRRWNNRSPYHATRPDQHAGCHLASIRARLSQLEKTVAGDCARIER